MDQNLEDIHKCILKAFFQRRYSGSALVWVHKISVKVKIFGLLCK